MKTSFKKIKASFLKPSRTPRFQQKATHFHYALFKEEKNVGVKAITPMDSSKYNGNKFKQIKTHIKHTFGFY